MEHSGAKCVTLHPGPYVAILAGLMSCVTRTLRSKSIGWPALRLKGVNAMTS